jgi:RNA polymerase sigma factor (sigma-70 family)
MIAVGWVARIPITPLACLSGLAGAIDSLRDRAQNRLAANPQRESSAVEPDQVYFAQYAAIEKAIAAICREKRLATLLAEDFGSAVHNHLIADGYEVFRKFRGESGLGTYLNTVISNVFKDWCAARWGKWHASVEAKRTGPIAEQLERLLVRDRLSFEEAYETLRTGFRVRESRQELEAMAARFPTRTSRAFVSDEVLEDRSSTEASPETRLRERDAATAAGRALDVLLAAVAALPAQDRIILRMHFSDRFPFSEIARSLHLSQQTLYPRVKRLKAELRKTLEKAGIDAAVVAEIVGQRGFEQLYDLDGADGQGREAAAAHRNDERTP